MIFIEMNSNELTRERENERTNARKHACTHLRGSEWLRSIANKLVCLITKTALITKSYHLIAEKYNVAFSCCIFKIHGAGVENQLLNVQFLTYIKFSSQ